jgi:anthranilate/para-aminobenzoate synthase component I
MRTVTRITLARWIPTETVVAAFGDGGEENVIWLDAGAQADQPGAAPRDGHPHRSYLGWGSRVLRADVQDPSSVDRAWAEVSASQSPPRLDADPLGWWGWIGYGVGASLLAPGDPAWASRLGDPDHPDLALLDVDRALVFDHDAGLVELVVLGEPGEHAAWVDRLVTWWQDDSVVPPSPPSDPAPAVAEWADTGHDYLDLIERCQAAIRDGDAFVMCLTTSVSVPGIRDDDLEIYRRLRRSSPAPRACFLRLEGVSFLSSTPETFLTVDRAGLVTSMPIKGTRPRGLDDDADRALVDELAANPKERAENLMIVDLMRNDLSRISVPGGVEVTELFGVHTYEHVHQLISTVRARLRPGLTGVDVVRATFPPGSMTGAPKHSVVGMLAEWEAAPRGIYSGAVGRFGLDGSLDLSVVIRSIVLDRAARTARIGVGGGITASSVPLEELEEIRTKAAALLAVLGAGGQAQAPLESTVDGPLAAPLTRPSHSSSSSSVAA